MVAWLSSLPAHDIFTLPSPARPSLSTHPSLAELARPASPSFSTISRASTSRTRDELPNAGTRKNRMVLVRGVDLVVAVGKELRIASLADVKARCEERDGAGEAQMEKEVQLGEYKVLNTPTITFEIQQLVLNATSKLLAVVGAHSIAIVVLPRKGWSSSVGRSLECRSLLVGNFYHSLPASPPVAQVTWHPWGANSSSLLVLTSDALLREYSIGDDAEEPAQTISFGTGAGAEKSGRGFSSDDRDAEKAVAFCVGDGKSDWGPLTLYGLMRNGDIFALCPFLPRKAAVPASYVHSLSAFVSVKVDYLASATTPQASPSSGTLQLARSSASSHALTHSTSSQSRPPTTLETIYALQLSYVNSLVRQASFSPPLSGSWDDHLVQVSPPPISRTTKPARQGPFLLQPAPAELENGAESSACDIAYVNYMSPGRMGSEREESQAGVGVLAVSFSDGKVDLCLEVEKVEAKWGERDEWEEEELPLLAVYETIDLGLAAALEEGERSVGQGLQDNCPTFVKDPLYPYTLYVYHALGGHCLLLSRWLDALADITLSAEEDEEKLQKEVERTLRAQQATDVLWILKTVSIGSSTSPPPVVGLSLINDIYLGYSLLLVTSSLQLVGIELSLRIDSSLLPSSSPTTPRGISSQPPPYLSLLDSPFTIPPPLDKRSTVSSVPRLATKPPGASSALVINPDTLRFLGKTVETFRYSIRDLVSAANVVQSRLELQMKELSRQLSKLNDLSRLSDTLRKSTSSREGLAGRLERVSRNQDALLQRTDRVLQKLMDAHQPLLSTYERKWFEELARLENVVEGKGSERSLQSRAERLEWQLESLRPALEELKRKEVTGVKEAKVVESPGGLGSSQMRSLETKLAEESKLIAEARKKLDRLTNALASTSLS